jgi:SAM-dependent methyltransferase
LRKILESIFSTYQSSTEKINIFDYGCGDVPYKPIFSNIAHSYLAGDIPENPCADIILESNGHVPCDSETFDVVLSIQVLEHVPDVNNYLQEARRVLKKNGRLVLSTHGWWTYHPYSLDLWRWTREGLIYLLKNNGFNVIDTYWSLGMLAYSFQLRTQCWKGILEDKGYMGRFLFRSISAIYQMLMFLADRITPVNIGQNNAAVYVIIAQKNNQENHINR